MKRWLWLIPLIAGAVAYAPAPWGELVFDDSAVVGFQLEPFHTLHDVLRPPDDITRWSYGYYRPVVIVSYLADARLFGAGSPAGPHIVNVACHLLTTLLVWLLARRVFRHLPGGSAGAVVAATVFAVHPIHTESVSWIAGRSDVLATLFLVLSLLLALRWLDRRSPVALLLAPVFFLLALLSKEIAIVGLALLPLLFILVEGAVGGAQAPIPNIGACAPPTEAPPTVPPPVPPASAIAIGIAFLAAAAAWFWLRHFGDTVSSEIPALPWDHRLSRVVIACGWYLVKLVMPWPQSAFVSWYDVPGLAASACVAFAALAGTAWALWRWRRRGDRLAPLAAGWFWIALAPLLWIAAFTINNTPIAERYLYLPSIAFALALGGAFRFAWARGWRWQAAAAAAALLAVGVGASIQRGLVWRTDLALWTDTSRQTAAGLPWMNLGILQLGRGDTGPALVSYRRALADAQLEPKWQGRSHLGAGTILAGRGADADAEREFRAAIQADPEYAEPYYRLGMIHVKRAKQMQGEGRREDRDQAAASAINYLATATARDPRYRLARLALAGFLADYGQMIERDGDSGQAFRRYLSALDQLTALAEVAERAPKSAAAPRELTVPEIAAQSGVDPLVLRRDLDAALARLRSGAD